MLFLWNAATGPRGAQASRDLRSVDEREGCRQYEDSAA
jgi:hypothetical protein